MYKEGAREGGEGWVTGVKMRLEIRVAGFVKDGIWSQKRSELLSV